MTHKNVICCDFCGKHESEVETIIVGPGSSKKGNVYICNECVSVGIKIIKKEIQFDDAQTSNTPTPPEIKKSLDEYIIGQEYAKQVLSVSAYNHYKRISGKLPKVEKSNVLLVGASGTGKTLIAQTLSKIVDVPFAITDATSLTESGYVGDDVEAVIERLLSKANYDIERAQQGIVFIDEVDKKRRVHDGNTATRDVSGEGVQQSLLRLLEGTVLRVRVMRGNKEEVVDFDTTNVLFILGGAFVGLDTIMSSRTKTTHMGFRLSSTETASDETSMMDVSHEDIIKYGIIPELVGRVPVLVPLEELNVSQLIQVMTCSRGSAKSQFESLLKEDGIVLTLKNEFIREVAEMCLTSKLGARGIRMLLEDAFHSIMFRAPDLSAAGVTEVVFEKYPLSENEVPWIIKNKKRIPDDEYKIPRYSRNKKASTTNSSLTK